jgi:hypothetical protein
MGPEKVQPEKVPNRAPDHIPELWRLGVSFGAAIAGVILMVVTMVLKVEADSTEARLNLIFLSLAAGLSVLATAVLFFRRSRLK